MGKIRKLLVGTYTEDIKFGTGKILKGKGDGIYFSSLDITTGRIELDGLGIRTTNPSYLTVTPSKQFLYAVNELKKYKGLESGAVSAFSIANETYELNHLNTLPTNGTDPCHITVDDSGEFVFTANFMSGSIAMYRTLKNGALDGPVEFIQHQGSSSDPIRQSGPHAHAVTFDPNTGLLFVPDLGMDKLVVYDFDKDNLHLTYRKDLTMECKSGSGPRHLELHSKLNSAYLINELDSTVNVLIFSEAEHRPTVIQTVSLLPDNYEGNSTASDLHITSNGKYLYASNRGHDSIAGFEIDQETGKLSFIGHFECKGSTPRNFFIDSDGGLMIVALQDSDLLASYWIDETTGVLTPTGYSVSVPTPVCVKSL